MKTAQIDNSAKADLERCVIWQYDKAENLIGIIMGIMGDFFKQSTEDFWNDAQKRLAIADAESTDDFGLSMWGRLLGVPRPVVGESSMSTELYRRILVGRLRLLMSNASPKAYSDFVNYVFDGNVNVIDGGDMSITFAWIDKEDMTDLETEMEQLIEDENARLVANLPSAVFAFPTGIRSNLYSNGPVFGFDGQQKVEDIDFEIGNFNHSTIAWRQKVGA